MLRFLIRKIGRSIYQYKEELEDGIYGLRNKRAISRFYKLITIKIWALDKLLTSHFLHIEIATKISNKELHWMKTNQRYC